MLYLSKERPVGYRAMPRRVAALRHDEMAISQETAVGNSQGKLKS